MDKKQSNKAFKDIVDNYKKLSDRYINDNRMHNLETINKLKEVMIMSPYQQTSVSTYVNNAIFRTEQMTNDMTKLSNMTVEVFEHLHELYNELENVNTIFIKWVCDAYNENNKPCRGNCYVPKHGDCTHGDIVKSDNECSIDKLKFEPSGSKEVFDSFDSTIANAYDKDAMRFKQLFSQAYEPNNSNTENNATNDSGVITYEIAHCDNDTFIEIYRKIGDKLNLLAFFKYKPEFVKDMLLSFDKYTDDKKYRIWPVNTCHDTVEQLEVIQTYLDAIIQILQNK